MTVPGQGPHVAALGGIEARTAAERVGALLDRLAGDPDVRVVDGRGRRGRALTGSAFAELVRARRARLVGEGVSRADTVLFAVRPSVSGVAALLALVEIGARTVLVDLREPERLLRARLERVEPSVVVAEPLLRLAAHPAFAPLARRRGVTLPNFSTLAPRVVTLWAGRARASAADSAPPGPDDAALVVFTSGTTGRPKAVVHTQATLGAMISALSSALGDASGAVVLTGQYHSFVPALLRGAVVVLGRPDAPSAAARLIPERAVTTWFTTPSEALAASGMLPGSRALRRVFLGSAPVTPSLVRTLRQRWPGVRVTAVYGMTEAVPISMADGEDVLAHRGPGTLVGEVVPGVTVTIDAAGEIGLTGPRVGRHLDEAAGGPLSTGDLGRWAEEGRLVLDGRSKEMILVDGRNLYPLHYEDAFGEIEGVARGALVGVPDEMGNEALYAVVEPARPSAATRADPVAGIRASDVLGGLPIRGVVESPLPFGGRSHKLDRTALRAVVLEAIAEGRVRPA